MYKVPSPLRVLSRYVWSNKDNESNGDNNDSSHNRTNNEDK